MKRLFFLICLSFLLYACGGPVELKNYVIVYNDGSEVQIMAANYNTIDDVFNFYSDSCQCVKVASFNKKDVKFVKVDF